MTIIIYFLEEFVVVVNENKTLHICMYHNCKFLSDQLKIEFGDIFVYQHVDKIVKINLNHNVRLKIQLHKKIQRKQWNSIQKMF